MCTQVKTDRNFKVTTENVALRDFCLLRLPWDQVPPFESYMDVKYGHKEVLLNLEYNGINIQLSFCQM